MKAMESSIMERKYGKTLSRALNLVNKWTFIFFPTLWELIEERKLDRLVKNSAFLERE